MIKTIQNKLCLYKTSKVIRYLSFREDATCCVSGRNVGKAYMRSDVDFVGDVHPRVPFIGQRRCAVPTKIWYNIIVKSKTNSVNFFMNIWYVIRALFDKRTPWVPKIIGIAIIAYIILPFDLIPDYIPVVGWLDDAGLAALGLFIISKLVPKQVLEEYRDGKPAIPGSGIRRPESKTK
jgi:uncharacterized membrane protein YkvA (DUF1232 family)